MSPTNGRRTTIADVRIDAWHVENVVFDVENNVFDVENAVFDVENDIFDVPGVNPNVSILDWLKLSAQSTARVC